MQSINDSHKFIFKEWLTKGSVNDTKDIHQILQRYLPSSYISEKWLNTVSTIVYRMSETPWQTQRDISEEAGLTKEELIEINEVIRDIDFLQYIIIKCGLGKKYWNTMIPFANSTMNVIEHKYNFPIRIAIFPGLSCMFYCGFCGRNQKAAYSGKLLKDGNGRFKNILKSLPKNSAISISGGLEPLTNPKLGEIISYAKSLGIRVPLITNGYSMTPKYLQKHSGLWDLDSLRISLYGIDEESYDFITRKPGSYELVKNNTINFLKERNKINPNLKFGFNYIIIPETMDHMLPLLDLISEINSKVDNGPGVDFLTLREDFGSVTDGSVADDENRKYRLENFLSEDERNNLVDTFKDFGEKQKDICPDLHVDFGYALVALDEGVLGKPLAKVNGKEMRKSGYPQLSVAVDLNGDVFLYREAGFLDRIGNKKFIAGRIDDDTLFEDVIREYVENEVEVKTVKHDNRFMDSFDHILTILVNQAEDDLDYGVPFNLGPVKGRYSKEEISLGNNWYKDTN